MVGRGLNNGLTLIILFWHSNCPSSWTHSTCVEQFFKKDNDLEFVTPFSISRRCSKCLIGFIYFRNNHCIQRTKMTQNSTISIRNASVRHLTLIALKALSFAHHVPQMMRSLSLPTAKIPLDHLKTSFPLTITKFNLWEPWLLYWRRYNVSYSQWTKLYLWWCIVLGSTWAN